MKKLAHSVLVLATFALLTGCHFGGGKDNNNNNNTKEDNKNEKIENNNGSNENNAPTPTEFSGSIDTNTTWPDLGLDVDYVIDGRVNVDGNAMLTIEPGVTIMFNGNDGGFWVGENAGLKMVGTAEKPIILEGPTNNPNNGSWHNIQINSKRNDNQFEYVQFLRGGSSDYEWDGVVRVDGRLSMKNCIIDGSLGNGLVLNNGESYLTAFENNTIKNCAEYPWYNERFATLCKNIGSGNTFVDNGKNMIAVTGRNGNLEENLTLQAQPVPFHFLDGMDFNGNKTVTIEPGVDIILPINTNIIVREEVGFKADGTEEKPIVFRCEEEEEAWNGIMFESKRNNNVMNHCQIKRCGTNDSWTERSCLYIRSEAKLTLTNNVFGPSFYNGVGIENMEHWGNVTHSDNTFIDCKGGNIWLEGGGEYNGTEYEGGKVLEDLP